MAKIVLYGLPSLVHLLDSLRSSRKLAHGYVKLSQLRLREKISGIVFAHVSGGRSRVHSTVIFSAREQIVYLESHVRHRQQTGRDAAYCPTRSVHRQASQEQQQQQHRAGQRLSTRGTTATAAAPVAYFSSTSSSSSPSTNPSTPTPELHSPMLVQTAPRDQPVSESLVFNY
jgi:hypothetical protein